MVANISIAIQACVCAEGHMQKSQDAEAGYRVGSRHGALGRD
jgi:hypothetical protein